MKVLKLTLHKKAFEVMVTGEKCQEYRTPSEWIKSRLKGINYGDMIEFTNGYGASRPRFTCVYLRHEVSESDFSKSYSNTLCVAIAKGDIIIHLGNIKSIENYKP